MLLNLSSDSFCESSLKPNLTCLRKTEAIMRKNFESDKKSSCAIFPFCSCKVFNWIASVLPTIKLPYIRPPLSWQVAKNVSEKPNRNTYENRMLSSW